jgi:hypothetical protein
MGLRSSRHGLYKLGYSCVTMVVSKSCKGVTWSKSQKSDRSSNCWLKFANMKLESLVIVDQHATVNILGALYTPPVTSGEGNWLEVEDFLLEETRKIL